MCDCEMPTLYDETIRTARKSHICSSCYSDILARSKYFDIRGLWNGRWDSYKRCESCHAIATKFADEIGECVPIENLISELKNCDLIENQSGKDDSLVWVSNVDWLQIKSQIPLKVRVKNKCYQLN